MSIVCMLGPLEIGRILARGPVNWVAVQELTLSYQNPESILFTIYPCYGNLK